MTSGAQNKGLGVILVIAILVTIAVAGLFQIQEPAFNPPYLAFALQALFVFGVSVAVAVVSAGSYLRSGSINLAFLGSALLINGFITTLSVAPIGFSSNTVVTVANLGVLLSSVIQFLGAIATFLGANPTGDSGRKNVLVTTYIVSALLICGVILVGFSGLFPVLLTPTGPTLLRLIIISSTIVLLLASCFLFSWQYYKTRSTILYWYSLALALFGVALIAAFFTITLGDLMNWASRMAIYLSGVYFLFALLSRSAETEGDMAMSQRWAETFAADRSQSATLLANMLDAFVYARILTDDMGKPIDWVYLDVNDEFEKISGKTRQNVVGKKVSEVFPDEGKDPVDWIGRYGQVALTMRPAKFGSYSQSLGKWLEVAVYSPKKRYFVSIIGDVTERKKAQKEIESLAKFPMENPAVVLRIDQKGIVLFANPQSNDFLKKWQTGIGLQAPEKIRQMVVNALSSGDKIEFEENLGNEIFSFLIAPISVEGYANLYGRSITKRKKVEAKLEEYTKNLEMLVEERTRKIGLSALYARRLIEASLDPLVTISADGKIMDVNKSTEEATGFSRDQLIGSDFSDYFTEPEKARAGYRKVFTDGFVKDYHLAIRHKSGIIIDVLYNATVYRNEAGEIEGVFAAARDITERRKLEKQVQDAERLASIGATAGMVGHDIRNPLQAMLGDIYLVKEDLISVPDSREKQDILESLNAIANNVDYVNKIVADLQDYSRPLKPIREEVNLESVLDDLLLKHEIPKNIEATVKISKNAKVITSDSSFVKRIIENLMTNALQAMPSGGSLSIAAYRDEGAAVIVVEDSGNGIPDDVKGRLFTPLFTTKSKGQGFGLAVVKRMTEALGGQVSFESELDKGTKFTVRLPQKPVR